MDFPGTILVGAGNDSHQPRQALGDPMTMKPSSLGVFPVALHQHPLQPLLVM